MKILTVCHIGHNRSVTARHILTFNHDVIACGVNTNDPSTITMLCDWADTILLAEPDLLNNFKLPPNVLDKIDQRFTIGADVYPSRMNTTLYNRTKKQLKRLGYLEPNN